MRGFDPPRDITAMASIASASELSGLAKTLVENAIQGDTKEPYSLSNYNEERINKLVDDVFSKKLKVPAKPGMVRFTFIIGGGKKVREKYDPACQKNLTAALRKYKFEDDQGLRCCQSALANTRRSTIPIESKICSRVPVC